VPHFDLLVLDADSTLFTIEGIDELARLAGCFEEVRAATARMMDSSGMNPEVYRQRLRVVSPTPAMLEQLARLYRESATPGAAELVAAASECKVGVRILSGGIREALLPAARDLGIREEHVYAVTLLPDQEGRLTRLQEPATLAQADGKSRLVRAWKDAGARILMAGDGMSDLEAAAHADLFVGFGGVVRRAAVEARCQHYVAEPDLRALIPFLDPHQSRRSP
jgi:phosphoserine phosphatase